MNKIKDFKKLSYAIATSDYQSSNRMKHRKKFLVIKAKQAIKLLHNKFKDNANYQQILGDNDLNECKTAEDYRYCQIHSLKHFCKDRDLELLQQSANTLAKFTIA